MGAQTTEDGGLAGLKMNIVPGNAPMPVGAAAMPMAPASRAYTVKPAGQEENEQKEITTEQIQVRHAG
ncbi:hypothetical protein ATCC90586_011780 [Pythium insidiosum]|nr:hypothetical protein ATCC90586_011780 [Pythium insidiosum]